MRLSSGRRIFGAVGLLTRDKRFVNCAGQTSIPEFTHDYVLDAQRKVQTCVNVDDIHKILAGKWEDGTRPKSGRDRGQSK